MSVTVLFLALWGRAMVIDTDTLADSLAPLSESNFVRGYVADWIADEMVDSGADPQAVEPAIDYLIESSSVGESFDQLVSEMVHAAAGADPEGSRIDMAGLFRPTVPELTASLEGLGYPVTEGEVAEFIGDLDPLVIRAPGEGAMVGPSSPTAARLGTAALLAVLAMAGFGFGLIALAEDRVGEVRSLMTRVAVGGLSFAVFLRVGSWVLDPGGGRAPVRSSLSALAASKWLVPLQVALVAAILAAGLYFGRRLLKRREGFRSADEQSTHRSEQLQSRTGHG